MRSARLEVLFIFHMSIARLGEPIVHFKTSQTAHLRTIFDALRELIHDVNIHFIPDDSVDNTPGIIFTTMDDSHVSMVSLKLPAEQIRRADQFICKRQCRAGINVANFFKYLKTMGTGDVVSIIIYERDPDHLYLVGEDTRVSKKREFKIKLLEIDEEALPIPDAEFKCVFTMTSTEFQRLCRDLVAVDPDHVTVEATADMLKWTANGVDASMEVVLGTNNEFSAGICLETPASIAISNKYSLKYLTMFTKATPLCSAFRIHLAPNFPIILDYEVTDLGLLRFCLAPKICDADPEPITEDTMEDEDEFF